MSVKRFSLSRLNSKNTSPTNPIAGFNAAYTSLINSFSGTKYYIDPVNGSDLNDGLTLSSAYATYSKFYTVTSSNASSIMCIFMAGTHTLTNQVATPYSGAYGACAIKDNNYQRTYVCAGGNAIMDWSAASSASQRDVSPFELQNSSSVVYGGVWKRNNGNRANSYSVAWFNNETVTFKGKLYNCVLYETSTNGNWTTGYSNSAYTAGTQANYCTFYTSGATAPWSPYSSSSNLVLDHCVNNGTVLTSVDATSTITSHVGTTINSSYVAATGTSGVYYGTYAWS